ncbi:hypothetical protein GCM10018779_37430 [Streptomyces griseocarneus]|nr:hypothetical protein GCM10018779_37430 [Streptomyces griseocarneus]
MALFIAGTGKGAGAYGLAPGAKVLPLRVANPKSYKEQSTMMASAIRYAADSDARVINISMAGWGQRPEEDSAISYALAKGKLIFAGVGNTGDKDNAVQYPAATPGVIGVAAVNREVKAAPWSQHGPQVDLAAPGTDMVAPCTDGTGGLCTGDGTSDATALASASAALVWSAHPDWTANQVLRVLINTAGAPKSGEKRSDAIGYGVVRPRIALQNPGDPGPADVSPLPELAAAAPPANRTVTATARDVKATGNDAGLLSTRNAVIAAAATAIALAVAVPMVITRRRRKALAAQI